MLGKICFVGVLMAVSACLMRSPEPRSKEKFAKVLDEVGALLSKWGAKSPDEAVAKMFGKADGSYRQMIKNGDAEDLYKIFKHAGDNVKVIAALKKPVFDKMAKVDGLLEAHKKAKLAGERIRKMSLEDLRNGVKDLDDHVSGYDALIAAVKRASKGDNIAIDPSLSRKFELEYPASKVIEIKKSNVEDIFVNLNISRFRLVGTTDEIVEAGFLDEGFSSYRGLRKFVEETIASGKTDDLLAFNKRLSSTGDSNAKAFYNSFLQDSNIKTPDGSYFTYIFARTKTIPQFTSQGALIERLNSIQNATASLQKGLTNRAILLEKSGLTAPQRTAFVSDSLSSAIFVGGGAKGDLTIAEVGIDAWAKGIKNRFVIYLEDLQGKIAFSDETTRMGKEIEKSLDEIGKLKL